MRDHPGDPGGVSGSDPAILGGRYLLGLQGEEGDDEPPYHIFYLINL